MNGFVDGAGRALLNVELKPRADAAALTISAWIDTGFTGDLVLPRTLIDNLLLPQSGTVGAILADGSQVAMSTLHVPDQLVRPAARIAGRRQRRPVSPLGRGPAA